MSQNLIANLASQNAQASASSAGEVPQVAVPSPSSIQTIPTTSFQEAGSTSLGTASSQASTPITTPNGAQTPPQGQSLNQSSSVRRTSARGWRSWKIHWVYLSSVLFITIAFMSVITGLTVLSRRESGFARESQPPAFLQRNPGLRKAIWEQGILYTALPAFVMTVYRTMWDASVMAFADRQPYVDLMKSGGSSARRTILLDYKMEPLVYRWVLAFRNKHYLLSACMLASLVLSFGIVPLTSFLFSMDTSISNSTFPFAVDTYYNATFAPNLPLYQNEFDVRLVLDAAAGLHLHNLSFPPRTDGTVAFAHITPRLDIGSSNTSVEIAAHGVDSGCVVIPESESNMQVGKLGSNIIVGVRTIDRMCAISKTLIIRTDVWSPHIWLSSWSTTTCSEIAGWSRISLLAARYDSASQTVQNITFLACKPTYFATTGTLIQRFEPGFAPHLLRFNEAPESREESGAEMLQVRSFLEREVQDFRTFDKTTDVDGNEFAKYVYRIAQRESPQQPLDSEALAEAAQKLYNAVYSLFASIYMFQPLATPVNGTGVYTTEEKRLFVAPVVPYVIIAVLTVTAVLNACLFFYARRESMLREEPFGLISYAGLLYKSPINQKILKEIISKGGDPRKAREKAKELYELDKVRWHYDGERIAYTGGSLEMTDLNGPNAVQPARTTKRDVLGKHLRNVKQVLEKTYRFLRAQTERLGRHARSGIQLLSRAFGSIKATSRTGYSHVMDGFKRMLRDMYAGVVQFLWSSLPLA